MKRDVKIGEEEQCTYTKIGVIQRLALDTMDCSQVSKTLPFLAPPYTTFIWPFTLLAAPCLSPIHFLDTTRIKFSGGKLGHVISEQGSWNVSRLVSKHAILDLMIFEVTSQGRTMHWDLWNLWKAGEGMENCQMKERGGAEPQVSRDFF